MRIDNIHITILADNRASADQLKEHGFSACIEALGHRMLFDTGSGTSLLSNAAKLGCDLHDIDTLVLSHGHYDHSGAVSDVLSHNPAMKLFCHPDAMLSRYSTRGGGPPRDISIPLTEKLTILGLPAEQICWVTNPLQLHSDIGISGPIPRIHPLENTGGSFFLDPDGRNPDPLKDDMSMWIQSDRGLVIITGCCHSGLINTVNHIRRISGHDKISAVIGGFHLEHANRLRLEATCQALRDWNVETIIPCHCTGEEAIAFMQSALGEKVVTGYVGLSLKIL